MLDQRDAICLYQWLVRYACRICAGANNDSSSHFLVQSFHNEIAMSIVVAKTISTAMAANDHNMTIPGVTSSTLA